MRKRNIARVVLLVFVLTILGVIGRMVSIDTKGSNLFTNKSVFIQFIKDNGRFPQNEQELIEKGYMKIISSSGRKHYKYRIERDNGFWYDLESFDSYEYSYGISMSELKYDKGIVYQKDSNQPFLFIDGPHSDGLLKKSYIDATKKIYGALEEANK